MSSNDRDNTRPGTAGSMESVGSAESSSHSSQQRTSLLRGSPSLCSEDAAMEMARLQQFQGLHNLPWSPDLNLLRHQPKLLASNDPTHLNSLHEYQTLLELNAINIRQAAAASMLQNNIVHSPFLHSTNHSYSSSYPGMKYSVPPTEDMMRTIIEAEALKHSNVSQHSNVSHADYLEYPDRPSSVECFDNSRLQPRKSESKTPGKEKQHSNRVLSHEVSPRRSSMDAPSRKISERKQHNINVPQRKTVLTTMHHNAGRTSSSVVDLSATINTSISNIPHSRTETTQSHHTLDLSSGKTECRQTNSYKNHLDIALPSTTNGSEMLPFSGKSSQNISGSSHSSPHQSSSVDSTMPNFQHSNGRVPPTDCSTIFDDNLTKPRSLSSQDKVATKTNNFELKSGIEPEENKSSHWPLTKKERLLGAASNLYQRRNAEMNKNEEAESSPYSGKASSSRSSLSGKPSSPVSRLSSNKSMTGKSSFSIGKPSSIASKPLASKPSYSSGKPASSGYTHNRLFKHKKAWLLSQRSSSVPYKVGGSVTSSINRTLQGYSSYSREGFTPKLTLPNKRLAKQSRKYMYPTRIYSLRSRDPKEESEDGSTSPVRGKKTARQHKIKSLNKQKMAVVERVLELSETNDSKDIKTTKNNSKTVNTIDETISGATSEQDNVIKNHIVANIKKNTDDIPPIESPDLSNDSPLSLIMDIPQSSPLKISTGK